MSKPRAHSSTPDEDDVVKAVVACATDVVDGDWGNRQWVHLFVDFEIDQSGERTSSISFALGKRPAEQIEKVSFRLSPQAKRSFAALADSMGASPNGRWTSAQLRIAPDGNYDMIYSYAAPYRLSGNLIDDRFRDYVAQWMANANVTAGPAAPTSFWRKIFGS